MLDRIKFVLIYFYVVFITFVVCFCENDMLDNDSWLWNVADIEKNKDYISMESEAWSLSLGNLNMIIDPSDNNSTLKDEEVGAYFYYGDFRSIRRKILYQLGHRGMAEILRSSDQADWLTSLTTSIPFDIVDFNHEKRPTPRFSKNPSELSEIFSEERFRSQFKSSKVKPKPGFLKRDPFTDPLFMLGRYQTSDLMQFWLYLTFLYYRDYRNGSDWRECVYKDFGPESEWTSEYIIYNLDMRGAYPKALYYPTPEYVSHIKYLLKDSEKPKNIPQCIIYSAIDSEITNFYPRWLRKRMLNPKAPYKYFPLDIERDERFKNFLIQTGYSIGIVSCLTLTCVVIFGVFFK